jgi:hypothetical protein
MSPAAAGTPRWAASSAGRAKLTTAIPAVAEGGCEPVPR